MPGPVETKPNQSPNDPWTELLEPVRAALGRAAEPERYRVLAALLGEMARQATGRSDGQAAQVDALNKRLLRLGEEKALVDDALAQARADVERSAKQVEAEQQRAKETERIAGEQRTRLTAAQQQIADLETQLTARQARVHELENEQETLRLKAQRAEMSAGDTRRVDTLQEDKRSLNVEVERLRAELDRQRQEKDATIEKLKAELAAARGGAASGGGDDATLAALWERLAQAKPALAPGGTRPNVRAAERLVDAFIELTRFAHDFDQSVRPFLTGLTRYNQAVARPWDVYAKSPGVQDVVQEIIDVQTGKPAAVLKMRLLGLKRWIIAAIIGGDTAIESVAHELEAHLRGPQGMESDPNRRIRDYIRDDGHQLFHQHIREVRSQKLADAYAHGV